MILFLKALQFCFGLIFRAPAGVSLAVMRAASWTVYTVARLTRLKRNVVADIKLVMPDSPAEAVADRLIKNTSDTIFEILCVPFFQPEHYQAIFKWEGLEHVDRALKAGKGVIMLTMHFGNYESPANALARRGYKISSILKATDEPYFEIINNSRRVGGINLINVLEDNMYTETLKALARNDMVYILADTGALESRHEYFDFLGHKVPVATGWLTLAQRAGCPVIPTLSRREDGVNLVTFFPPVTVSRDNREAVMQSVGKTFEGFVKQYPENWAMFLNPYETKRMVEGK
ncbi:MAG: lysophospholipid acyltransferase family protein [Candidatus Margulisbacteria bacterium]|nr:lysophospholipid acyltransferase family protein [Candidatus Margulisiibacteriota bacterium]